MFSNSSILPPKQLQSDIFYKFSINNAYFNSQRLSAIHSIIFLAAFILTLLIFLMRYTLVRMLLACFSCCKNLADKFGFDEVVSDDFYEEVNIR